jgi:sortase A
MTETVSRATNRGAPPRPAPAPPARSRRVQRALSVVLIAAGALLLTDAVLTVTWQEPITAYFTQRTQDRLARDLDKLKTAPPTKIEQAALASLADNRRRIAFLARSLQSRTAAGAAVGRIRIPKIGAAFVVVKGSAAGDLRKGPGLYNDLPFPGTGSTTAIAGHRTTYLAPFRNIDELVPGDRITLTMPYATFTYAVEGTRIVAPGDLSVLRSIGRERLVLSACHPLFSASKRIVVFARLVGEQPGAVLKHFGDLGGAGVGRLASGLKAGPPRGR